MQKHLSEKKSALDLQTTVIARAQKIRSINSLEGFINGLRPVEFIPAPSFIKTWLKNTESEMASQVL